MAISTLHGLYLLLDEQFSVKVSLVDTMKLAVEYGVRLFQYRNKKDSMTDCFRKGRILRQVALDAEATFIVNDRCDLALALEADGVHLGQADFPVELARKIVGEEKVIGVSTHCYEEVEVANNNGADYIGFGPIFSTTTKTNHESVVGINGLEKVHLLTTMPIFAIGGITLSSIPAIQQAGASGVAVASVVYNSENLEQTLQELVSCFSARP